MGGKNNRPGFRSTAPAMLGVAMLAGMLMTSASAQDASAQGTSAQDASTQGTSAENTGTQESSGATGTASGNTSGSSSNRPVTSAADALRQVSEAARVVERLREVAGMPDFLQEAHGLFVIPSYARAALGVGARAGEGVLVASRDGKWSDPVFYNLGGVSIGLQAGVKAGDLVFILNNEKALDRFRQQSNWTLSADAGFTIVSWSEKVRAGAGKGDVTVWDSTGGLFGNLSVGVTNISFDADDMLDYYGRAATPDAVLGGEVVHPRSAALKRALASSSPEQTATPGNAPPNASSGEGAGAGAGASGASN